MICRATGVDVDGDVGYDAWQAAASVATSAAAHRGPGLIISMWLCSRAERRAHPCYGRESVLPTCTEWRARDCARVPRDARVAGGRAPPLAPPPPRSLGAPPA